MVRTRFILLILVFSLLSGCQREPVEHEVVVEEPAAGQLPEQAPALSPEEPDKVESFLYGREFLNAGEQEVYDRLLEQSGGAGFYAEVPVPVEIDDYAAGRLITYFCYDNPQLFWAVPQMTLNADGQRCLRMEPELSPQELARRTKKLEEATARFLEGVGGSDFQIVNAVHDRLVQWVSQDKGGEIPESDNVYGTLVDGFAICDGYAKAFQYLLKRMGIPCVYYAGESLMTTRPHAWNAVLIDGEWTYVDVTWDAMKPGHTPHTYLGITLEEIERERAFLNDQYPEIIESDSTTYNYYRYRNYAVTPAGDGTPVRLMAEAFVNGLEDKSLSKDMRKVFLEIKIDGSGEEYRRYRDIFIQDVFLVLREIEKVIGERELPVRIATQGEITCNYKDGMRILLLYPEVADVSGSGGE